MIGRRPCSPAVWLLGAALWWLGTAAAMAQFSPWIPPALQDAERLQTELRTVEAQLKNAELRFTTAESRQKQGLVGDEEVREAAIELNKWRGVMEDLSTRMQRARLYQSLGRPVDVKFRDATVGDAAQVLAQTSGLTITVDPALQPAGRVTMTANQIPVVEVLRLLAQNTKAQVAPKPGAVGILLRPVPTLEVDGQVREFPGPSAPWSPEWFELGGPPQQAMGTHPLQGMGGFGGGGVSGGGFGSFGGGAGGGVGGGVGGGPGFGGGRDPRAGNAGPGGGPMPGGPGAPGGFAPGGMPQPGVGYFPQPEDATLAITAVGPNRFIVASHVGRREGPMAGRMGPLILLSLYEIKDGQMRLLSTRVHEPGPVPGLQMPGAPGVGPGPGAPGIGPRRVPPGGRAPDPRPGVQPAPQREARPGGGQDEPSAPAPPVP